MRAFFLRNPFFRISIPALVSVVSLAAVPVYGQVRGGGANNGISGSGGTATGTRSTGNNSTTSPFPDSTQSRGPIYLSGRVMLDDGTPPPEPVKIERACGASVRIDAYTDHKGHFSFQIGQNFEMQDASDTSFGGRGLNGGGQSFPGANPSGGVNEKALWGCDLRASLPGYRSDAVSLTNVHYLDNPDVGTIILHRLANVQGFTVSATSALAPKDAKKSFEKGLDSIAKHNEAEAQKDFEKAASLYPKYAAAWFELGKLSEQHSQFDDAKKDYQKALEADDKYVPPYDRLSWLAMKNANWKDVASDSDHLLSLDPVSYPDAYYLNALANYQLQNFDVAEKQAREAIRLDPAKKNVRAYYVLGLTLAMKHDYAGSQASIQTFIDAAPKDANMDGVREQLKQIEQAAAAQAPAAALPATDAPAGTSKQP